MIKNAVIRFCNGYAYAILITMIIQGIIMAVTGHTPMLPEFADRFDSEVAAYIVQMLLIGLNSAVASAGSVIMELKKPGLIVQSILYFAVMAVVWIPVGCYLWGLHKYPTTFISFTLSLIVTYGICWGIQYRICMRDVAAINERLQTMNELIEG